MRQKTDSRDHMFIYWFINWFIIGIIGLLMELQMIFQTGFHGGHITRSVAAAKADSKNNTR